MILFFTWILIVLSFNIIACDYIKSNEIILYSDAVAEYSQIINLNDLLTKNDIKFDMPNIFKLVKDTTLVNYVFIEDSKVFLKNSFVFGELCNNNPKQSCLQTLKIIAVNDNHFIEIPVRIQLSAAQTTNNMPITLKPLEPLYFEHPSYSLEIPDNLKSGQLILMPNLVSVSNDHKIVFTMTEKNSDFFVDNSNGYLSLKRKAWDLLRTNKSELLLERTSILNIKATYEQEVLNSSFLFYDYMLPAFAKVIIKIKHMPANITVEDKVLDEKIKRANALKFNLNEPLSLKSALLSLTVKSDLEQKDSINEWVLNDDNNLFFEVEQINQTYSVLRNVITPQDLKVYKLSLSLYEKNRIGQGSLFNLEIVITVNFNPIVFYKSSYIKEIVDTNVIEENLVQMSIRPTHAKQKSNMKYSLTNKSDKFAIDSNSGWISAMETLVDGYYVIQVLAKNLDTQFNKTVDVEFKVKCEKQNTNEKRRFQFQIFENSPNQTKIGVVKSVCANTNLNYEILDFFTVETCAENCSEIYLNNTHLKLKNYLTIDQATGNLLINNMLNFNTFENFTDSRSDRLTIKIYILGKNEFKSINYQIEIQIIKSPKVQNFHPQLAIGIDSKIPEGIYNQECIYSYSYLLDKTMKSPAVIRFVKIDNKSGAHLKAIYMLESINNCSPNLIIHNNGCVALKYNSLCKNLHNDSLILKSNNYNMEFKVCYYDVNQVSCSPLYNQYIRIIEDIFASSKVSINFSNEFYNSELDKNLSQIKELSGVKLVQSISTNVYFIVLITLLVLAVIILIIILITFKICNKRTRNSKMNSNRDFKIQTNKPNISFSKTASNLLNNSNQNIEASLNIITAGTKFSNDVENNPNESGVSKIRVSDDYLINMMVPNLNSEYVYTNANFSYAGSFLSLSSGSKTSNSSSCKTTSSDVLKNIKISNIDADDHGLYSVKNALIKYENSSEESDSSIVKESKCSIFDPNACLLKVTDNDEKINREFLCNYSNSTDCNQYKIVNFNNRLVENKPNIYESYHINKNSFSNNKNISDNVIASIV